jgi:uncharacterized protein with NAD-binding domain and iron-sulfur cluster
LPEKVAILGGGVAGLSAAHELIERGFEVDVYEAKDLPGGKARSLPAPYTGATRNIGTVNIGRASAGRGRELPGEHGFRFFPRFYKHVVDTMRRIPYGHGATVADNLVDTHKILITRFRRRSIELPARFPRSLDDLQTVAKDFAWLFDQSLGISWDEKLFFGQRVWQLITSCAERRLGEYEKLGWWNFVGASQRSTDYQRFFALGVTRSLVAARAETASTRTIGDIFVQLLFDIAEPGISSDRVLNGPTNEVWIEPWLEYLRARGVRYHLNSRVQSFSLRRGRIECATVERDRRVADIRADYYVAALPVEVMARLVTPELIAADAGLGNIIPLSKNVEWMNGIQLYLTEDVPIVRGHVIYVDSPWALTSISQRQFWPSVDFGRLGSGRVRGIISVDISNWDTPGLNGKPARACTREEIRDDVWEQLKASLNVEGQDLLKDEYLHDFFLDPAIDPLIRSNGEPLLVNLVDSWRLRPEAATAIPNFFLASDYVRTYTDLATMEGANEAARRAVNALLQRAGSAAPLCQVWDLHEPDFLAPLRAYDRVRYERGLPWDPTLAETAVGVLAVIQHFTPVVSALAAAALAALDHLEQQFPNLGILQVRPEILTHLASQDQRPHAGPGGHLAPLLDRSAERFPGLVGALQKTVQDLVGRAALARDASTPRSGPDASAPMASDQHTPPEGSGGVRFVQR